MNILMGLILLAAPPAIIFCVYKAWRGTRKWDRVEGPAWFVSSSIDINGPDRKWGLKR